MSDTTLRLLTWLIPVGPLVAFVLIVAGNIIIGRTRMKTISWLTALSGMLVAVILSWTVAFHMFGLYEWHEPESADAYAAEATDSYGDEADYGEEATDSYGEDDSYADDGHSDNGYGDGHSSKYPLNANPVQIAQDIVWMPFGVFNGWGDCEECIFMGVSVDPLTTIMLFMVPFAVLMIFIYSIGYHNYGKPNGTHLGEPNHGLEEPLFSRFFAMMCLFAGAMLTLVVADNVLMLFVGWEVMGFCSYSLIGFWYARTYGKDPKNPQKLPPRYASIKAFMTTRVADVVMLVGIVFFFRVFGTLNFSQALSAESLMTAADSTIMGLPGGVALAIMSLLLFTGTVGKSAQWPLHVWLPNAMEGPTPVSAVIHAAAMVSAGIYLLLRIFPLLAVGAEAWPAAKLIVAFIGAFTALMAATIAVAQDDVKGVLAYSTISQLGFMVAAIGIGAYIAAAFHLITHAFFKALLFLSSGSVIHGMEHGAEHVHDHHTDPQDMINMGGLAKKMPWTAAAFTIGGLALSGFPFVTAGFWSKDEIFADAWLYGKPTADHPDAVALFVFIMLALAAFLTAFYTARQLCLTFLGEPRTPLAEHAHESNGFMVIPLVLLSFFAITAGWVGIPEDLPVLGSIFNQNYFHHFVGATLYEDINILYDAKMVAHKIKPPPFNIVPVITSLAVALGGLGLGYLMYGLRPLKEGEDDPLKKWLGPIHTFLMNKWYWDELYTALFIKPATYFSEVIVYQWIDKGLIDGFLHLIAKFFYGLASLAKRLENAIFDDAVDWTAFSFLDIAKWMRGMQRGKIQEYALFSTVIFSLFAFAVLYFTGALQGILG